MNAIVPTPRCAVTIRPATMDDLPFIDRLQKAQSHQVGFLHTGALEEKIRRAHVIIAEEGRRDEGTEGQSEGAPSVPLSLCPSVPAFPVGYCIGNDQYFKRDDVGIIYQVNVMPRKQRALIGAMLVKAMFDRAAYGCRLFCCWCAQDIEANCFWESLGFIPLAFRAGSREKDRVHIFWQRRIREGDTTTPYWFPSQTTGGLIGEARLVLPIPPGTHWRDVMPRLLPTAGVPQEKPALPNEKAKTAPPAPKPPKRRFVRLGPPPSEPQADAVTVRVGEKPKREKKPKAKNDPKLVAAARELRDRWLEHVNADPSALLPAGKYDVARQLVAPPEKPTKQLPHAA
jgi:hypothetical protein